MWCISQAKSTSVAAPGLKKTFQFVLIHSSPKVKIYEDHFNVNVFMRAAEVSVNLWSLA